MNDKPILKELIDDNTIKTITELASLYGIEYKLKPDNDMTKKTIKIKEIEGTQPHEISKPQVVKGVESTFRQLIQESPVFKTFTKFLWLPKTINGEWKWLVTASWQEQFVEAIDQEAMDSGASTCLIWVWKPVKWL